MSEHSRKNAPAGKKYVAFLRGINVGGHTLLKMEELKKAFEALGFRDVRTVLASGNVLFEAPETEAALARVIGKKLEEALGRKIVVIVRARDDLRGLEAKKPFEGIEGVRRFVTFLPEKAGNRDISGPALRDGFRILSVSGGMVCSILDERPGVGAVHLMSAIEKEFGPAVTTRTWDTILKVLKADE